MNNKQVVSIGVQLDYKKELESMLADLRSELDKVRKSSSDIKISNSLQEQIKVIEKEFQNMSKYVDESFEKMGNSHVKLSDFSAFQDEMLSKVSALGKEINQLASNFELVNTSLNKSKSGISVVADIQKRFDDLYGTVYKVAQLMKDFRGMTEKTKSDGFVDFQKFSLESARKIAKTLRDYANDPDYNPFGDREQTEKSLEKTLKDAEEAQELIKKTRDVISEEMDNGSAENDPFIRYLNGVIEEAKIRREQLINVASQIYDALDSSISRKYTDRFNDIFNINDQDAPKESDARNIARNMMSSIEGATAEVQHFIIKNGSIQIPMKIATTPTALAKEIKNTLDAIDTAVKPIEVPVKLVSKNARGEHYKMTQKEAQKIVDSETEEFASNFDEVAEGGELDLGKAFERTYSTTLKAAQKMAEASISEIRKKLTENKIVINPEVEIDQEKLDKIKEVVGEFTTDLGIIDYTDLFTEAAKILNTESIDVFMNYFVERWVDIAAEGGDIEKGFLTALNQATDKWKEHFLNVFNSLPVTFSSLPKAGVSNTSNVGASNLKIQNQTSQKQVHNNEKQFINELFLSSQKKAGYNSFLNDNAKSDIIDKYISTQLARKKDLITSNLVGYEGKASYNKAEIKNIFNSLIEDIFKGIPYIKENGKYIYDEKTRFAASNESAIIERIQKSVVSKMLHYFDSLFAKNRIVKGYDPTTNETIYEDAGIKLRKDKYKNREKLYSDSSTKFVNELVKILSNLQYRSIEDSGINKTASVNTESAVQNIKTTKDTKTEITGQYADIKSWETNFSAAINIISAQIANSFGDAYQKTISIWQSNMLNAIANISNAVQLPLSFNQTSSHSSVNSLYQTLNGWYKADRIMDVFRTGETPFKNLDEKTVQSFANGLSNGIYTNIIKSITDNKAKISQKAKDAILQAINPDVSKDTIKYYLNLPVATQSMNRSMERGAIYDTKTGKMFNDYVIDQSNKMRNTLVEWGIDITDKEKLKDYLKIHSHPVGEGSSGYLLRFSGTNDKERAEKYGGDFNSYLNDYKLGFRKFGLESDGMMALLDFSTLNLKQMKEVVKRYNEWSDVTPLVEKNDRDGNKYIDNAESSDIALSKLREILDSVAGPGAAEKILTVAEVEEFKKHPENFSQFIPHTGIEQQKEDLYSLIEVLKELRDLLQNGVFNGSVDIGDDSIFKIDESSFANIVKYLEEIQRLVSTAFGIATTDQINDKWTEVEQTFRRLSDDEKNLSKTGLLKKENSGDLYNVMDEYRRMGGTRDISEISGIDSKQSKKLQRDYLDYVSKQVVSATETTSRQSDIQKQLEQIAESANTLSPTIQSLIDLLNQLKKLLSTDSSEEFSATFDNIYLDLINIFNGLSMISPDLVKNFRSLINSLGNKKLGEFKMPSGLKDFINDLNVLSEKAQELDNIATILKSVSKGKNIGDVLSGQEQAGRTAKVSQEDYNTLYKGWIETRTNMLKEGDYQFVGDTDIKRTKDGMVELTTVVQEQTGAWKELKATVGDDGGIYESGVKALTDPAAATRVGRKNNVYNPANDLNKLAALYQEVNKYAKEYAKIEAKIGKGIEPTRIEKNVKNNVDRLKLEIENLENGDLKTNNVDIGKSRIGRLYYSYLNNIANVGQTVDFKAFSDAYDKFLPKIQEAQDAISKVREQIEKLDDSADFVEGIDTKFDGLVTDLASGKISAENFNKEWGKIVTEYKDIVAIDTSKGASGDIGAQLRTQLEQFTHRTDLDFKPLDTANAKVAKLVGSFRDVDNQIVTVTATLDRETGAIRVYTSKTQQYVNGLDKFFTSLKAKLQEGLRYLMAYVSVRDLWRYFRQGVEVVHQYDTALTEMRKVSDESVTSLKALQQQSFAWADEVGTTAVQLQNSIADFMRLGQETEKAIESAKTANILMNVSEFENISDATTALIAMEQAYQDLSGTEIIDKLNNIGNNFAIATDELSVALQASASALTTAGNSMDEAIAVITAGNLEIQDASKTGTGIQTIALRLTGTKEAKAELEELGEEVDDVITTQSKLRDTILQATKVASNEFKGFDILTDTGQYKSTYEILLGIAEIWDDIKENDERTGNLNQNLLLETLAGKRRANIAASILENPEILRDVFEQSQDSAGSAERELSKYLDSIDGKLQQFKNSLQELATDIIDNELVKGFIDFGTKAIDAIDKVAEHIPLIITALSAAGTVLTNKLGFPLISFGTTENGSWGMNGNIINSLRTKGINYDAGTMNFFSQYAKQMQESGAKQNRANFAQFVGNNQDLVDASGFADTINAIANETANLDDKMKNASYTIHTFSTDTRVADKTGSSLGNTFKNLGSSLLSGLASFGISTAINLAISGVFKLIDALVTTKAEIKEAGEAAQAEVEKIQKGMEDNRKEAETVAETYDRLSHGVDTATNRNLSLSSEEYEEYIDACNRIVALSPSFKDGVDTQGNAIVNFTGNVTSATAAMDEWITRQERVAAIKENEQSYDIIRYGLQQQEEYDEQIEQLNRQAGFDSTTGAVAVVADVREQLEDYLNGETSFIDVSKDQINALGDQWYDLQKELEDFLRNRGLNFQSTSLYNSETGEIDRFSLVNYDGILTEGMLNLFGEEINADQILDEYDGFFEDVLVGIEGASMDYADQAASLVEEANVAWQNSIDASFSYISKTSRYSNLTDSVREAIKNSFTIDPDEFYKENGKKMTNREMEKYIQTTYLDPIAKAWVNGDVETQERLTDLFTIDKDLPADEYIEKINGLLSELSGYFGDKFDDFKVRFGFDFEVGLGYYYLNGEEVKAKTPAEAVEKLIKRKGIDYDSDIQNYVSEMTVEQQLDIVSVLKDPAKTRMDISSMIRSAIIEGVGATSSYLTSYTEKKSAETKEAYTNAVTAVSNELTNAVGGYVDRDFARFIGGYNEGKDDDAKYLSQSLLDVVDNAEKARRYFTEDGLGLYSFAQDVQNSFGGVIDDIENTSKDIQINALENIFGGDVSRDNVEKIVSLYTDLQKAKFNDEDEEIIGGINDEIAKMAEELGFSGKESLLAVLEQTDAQFMRIKSNGDIAFKRTDRAVDYLAKSLGMNNEEVDVLLSSLESLGTINIDNVAFQSLQNDINLAKNNVEQLTNALSEISSQGYLSAETIGNLIAANPEYATLFQRTPGGTVIDANDVRDKIEQATLAEYELIEAQKNQFKTQAGDNYQKMLGIITDKMGDTVNAGKILTDVLSGNQDAIAELGDEAYSSILGLTASNQSLSSYIDNLEFLQEELRGSVSAMAEYKAAQSTANLSDNYSTIDSGQEAADKLYEQGWIGKDDFVTYAAFFANYGESSEQAVANYEANRERLQKYFTEDTSGLIQFLEDASNQTDGMIKKLSDGGYDINIPVGSMDEFAQKMGMTAETAMDLLLALNDAGMSFTPQGISDVLKEGLGKVEESLDVTDYTKWMDKLNQATKQGLETNEDLTNTVANTTDKVLESLGTGAKEVIDKVKDANGAIGGFVYTTDEAGNVVGKYAVATYEAVQGLQVLDETSETYRDDVVKLSKDLAALPEEEKVKIGITGLTEEEIQAKIESGELQASIPVDLKIPEASEQVDLTVAISQQSINDMAEAISTVFDKPFKLRPEVDTQEIQEQISAPSTPYTAQVSAVTQQYLDQYNANSGNTNRNTSGYTSTAQSANTTTQKVIIDADPSQFNSKLQQVQAGLYRVNSMTARPSIDANVNTAVTKIAQVRKEVELLKQSNSSVNITRNVRVASAAGTFTPAHATGTNVALKQTEDALVNEIGQESIVRNGQWMLLPGGAHVEHLKKGDIVFSAKQTEELLDSGRVSSGGGRGKAYADGTMNAYALGGTGKGKIKKPTTLSSSSSSSSNKGGSNGGNNNSSNTDPEKFDWIEVRIQRLEDAISNLDSKVQSTYSSWSYRNNNLQSEIAKVAEEIDNQARGYTRYIKEANSVGLSSKYKNLVQKGAIDIEKITNEDLRKKIDEYQKWYDKAMACKYAVDELKETLKGLYETQFEHWKTYWEEQMDFADAQRELYQYTNDTLSKSLTSIGGNVNRAIREVKDLTIYLNKAVQLGNIAKYSEAWYTMASAIEDAKLKVYEYQEQAVEAINNVHDAYNKLYEARQKYYNGRGSFLGERGELISTIRNDVNRVTDLQNQLLKDIAINGADYLSSTAYKERLAEIYESMNNVTDEYTNLIALDKQYYDNLIALNNVYADTVQKAYELDEAFGNYESIDKYVKQIESLNYNVEQAQNQAQQMTQDLDDAISSGTIKEGSTQWLQQKIAIQEVNNAVLSYKKQIEDANQALINLKYEEMFERATEKANHFIEKLETINGLLTDEMMYNYDTGFLTESGMLSLVLNDQVLDEHIFNLKQFVKERQEIIDDYNKGEFGTETFEERMRQVESSINAELKAVQSSRDAIINIIKTQTKAELDALNKVIDARKEALQKQKDYYDYDKTLKGKTKDIQLLKQQIQALEGVATAEAKAKKARLEAQLAEKNEDLEDTVRNHVYDLQVNGLDDLSKQLQENYDEYVNHISNSMENMSEAIRIAIETSGGDIEGAINTLTTMLAGMGVSYADIYSMLLGQTSTTASSGASIPSSAASASSSNAASTASSAMSSHTSAANAVSSATSATAAIESAAADAANGKTNAIDEGTQNAYAGTYTIRAAKDSNFAVDIAGGSTTSGANVQLYKANGTAAQNFEFIKNSDGTYTIKNTKSGMVLDVTGGSSKDGANVQQYMPNETAAQKWTVVKNSDGTYSFRNAKTGKMLDIYGNQMKNKANLQSYKANGTSAQKFYLKKKAKGDRFISKDGFYLTQEEGAEILSTKYGLLTPLSRGDGVVPADMTAKLYDIAANYDKFDASGFSIPATFVGTTNNDRSINCTMGDINFSGAASVTTKDLEKFREQIVQDVIGAITKDMRKNGSKKTFG